MHGEDDIDEVAVVGLRRNIAQRMQIAKSRIPHFTYVEELDVTEVERLRAELNRETDDSTEVHGPAVPDACRRGARRLPADQRAIRRRAGVVIGTVRCISALLPRPPRGSWFPSSSMLRVATAIVRRRGRPPVDRRPGQHDHIGRVDRVDDHHQQPGFARRHRLDTDHQLSGGGDHRSQQDLTRPVYVDGNVLPCQIMNLSSSFDHRVVDGADAAAFIQRIKALLETPALIFMSSAVPANLRSTCNR